MLLMIKCKKKEKKGLRLMGSPESTREKHVCASLLLVVWEVTVVFSSTKAETTFYFVSELWLISFYRWVLHTVPQKDGNRCLCKI